MKSYRLVLGALCIALSACEMGIAVMQTPQPPPDPKQPQASVRIAHLSPDAPAVDACLSPRGKGEWLGPVMKGLNLASGLSFGDVSGYLKVPEGAYDARLVAPGSADCSTGLLPDVTDLPALTGGRSYTVAALGELTATPATFQLVAYGDDSRPAPAAVRLRFVHAAAGIPAVDVGVGSGAAFTPVFSAVEYRAIGNGSSLINGYAEVPPLSHATLSARVTGGRDDALVLKEVSVPAGRAVTVFAVGSRPLRALWCEDASTGALSACAFVATAGTPDPMMPPIPPPTRAGIRVAHLSPGAPAVDVCVAVHGSGNFKGPLLGNGGLPYGEITDYLALDPDRYDVRIVAPGAPNCGTRLAGLPDVTDLPYLYAGQYGTVAATGVLSGTQQAFRVRAWMDERTAPMGAARLRFVHASPGTPAVDVGAGRGLSFTKLFANIPFGEIASGSLAYSNGYLSVPALTDAVVSARVAGSAADVLTIGGITLPQGATATAFAIGLLGSTATPLKVLVCVDSGSQMSGRSTCFTPGAAPPPATLRIAHLSPDAPAVDVCVAAHGTQGWVGPVAKSLGVVTGLAFSQVTGFLSLQPGQYDVRIVAPGAADCSTRLAGLPDTIDLPALGAGVSATVAAIGELTAGGAPFKLTAFVDKKTADVPAGKILFRFIHAAPGTPSVDVGLGTGPTFVPMSLDVAFGTTRGYVEREPFLSHTWLEVRPTGTVHAALSFGNITTDAGQVVTLFAIGKAPVRALYCRDTAPMNDILSNCFFAQ